MPAMRSKTYAPPAEQPATPYDAALSVIKLIDDDDYRRAARDALIVAHVKRVQGFPDPAGNLAMKLRNEASHI